MTEQEILSLFWPVVERMNGIYKLEQERPLLAHYTSIAVLEAIIKNEELWFSNPLFMNDLEEVRFGFIRGRQIIEQHDELAALLGADARRKLFYDQFLALWNDFDQNHALDVYVLCLSAHRPGDTSGRLSMWRGYGGQGSGVALVFNTHHFKVHEGSPLFVLKVEYGTIEERLKRFHGFVTELIGLLRPLTISDDQLKFVALGFYFLMLFFALATKDRGFDEESEWRVAYMPRHDAQKLLIDRLHYLVTARGVEPKLRFPIKSLPGAPVAWTFDDILEAIIVGPSVSSPLARNSVVRMLQVLGKPDFANRVIASQIPFRP